MREMINTSISNQLKFRYILMDSWFASKENFEFILKKKKTLWLRFKDNRLVACQQKTKRKVALYGDSLALSDKESVRGWLKGFEKEVLLVRRVFTKQRR